MCEGFFTADMTLGEARRTFRKLLAECDNAFVRQTPALDADVIICHFGGFSRTYLLTHEDEQISFFLAEELSLALGQRLSGLPVAYITNEKEFYGRLFYVDQNVLIPKPDTELLVDLAVADARRRMLEKQQMPSRQMKLTERNGGGQQTASSESVRPSMQTALTTGCRPAQQTALRIADICTGSGCIAISLLLELAGEPGDGSRRTAASMQPSFPSFVHSEAAQKTPGFAGPSMALDVVATDLSRDALGVAEKNVGKLVPDALRSRISLLEGDLCAPLDAAGGEALKADGGLICDPADEKQTAALFDIIVSNPPYVPASVTDELLSDGRGEPRLALDGDTDATLTLKADDGLASRQASESSLRSSDGLAIIRRLGPQVFAHLAPGGSFFLETGEYNAEAAAAFLETCGFTDVCIHRDLAGQLRVTEARRPL